MVFQNNVLSGAAGSATAVYEIEQSIRFNQSDSAFMYRNFSGAGNKKTATWSFWCKRADLGDRQDVISFAQDVPFIFQANDTLYVATFGASSLVTNRVFRDPSAWYHFVLTVDSTRAVASDRIRLYVNGQRETSFSTENYPSLNADANFYTGTPSSPYTAYSMQIGNIIGGSYYNGLYLAEIHFLDGISYGPEYFGETNSNGIWIPKEYDGSYGSNGFKIDGRDSADLGDDESGNGNDFTTSGLAAHDQVLDTPTNNFCVLTPLAALLDGSLVNGNLTTNLSGNDQFHANFDITEKTYCEVRLDASSNYGGAVGFGTQGGSDDDDNTLTFSTQYNSGQINLGDGSVDGNVGGTVSVGDVIMMAVDPDTRKWWVGVNGTWRNSGNPAAGSGQVYQYSTTYFGEGIGALVWGGWKGSANGMTVTWNFGQDSTFGGQETAGSSTDTSGNGIFKYTVPSGFKALCSKSMGS